MKTKRTIEMGCAWRSAGQGNAGEWSTDFVDIPGDTPELDIEAVAVLRMEFQAENDDYETLEHCWVSHIGEIEYYENEND